MIEFLESNPSAVIVITLLVIAYQVFIFINFRKQYLSDFPEPEEKDIVFREKKVAGRSKNLLHTLFAGRKTSLDIIVTNSELWIRGKHTFGSFLASKSKLLHKISLSELNWAPGKWNTIELKFTNQAGAQGHIQISVKQSNAFVAAIMGMEKEDATEADAAISTETTTES